MPDFKLYCRAIVMQTAQHWHKNRHESRWKTADGPDINLIPIAT